MQHDHLWLGIDCRIYLVHSQTMNGYKMTTEVEAFGGWVEIISTVSQRYSPDILVDRGFVYIGEF